MDIVLATRNRDKTREISAILAGLDVRLRTLDEFEGVPDVVEDGETLEANALKKAHAVSEATGLTALADDSGLFVDALDGAPGVYSSRYAGEEGNALRNTRKLLDELREVPEGRRAAEFRCVMALALGPEAVTRLDGRRTAELDAAVGPDGHADALLSEGVLHGRITTEMRGSGGFGYDPVFTVAEGEDARTLAEMTLDEKNEISHRYRALVEMRELLLRLELAAASE